MAKQTLAEKKQEIKKLLDEQTDPGLLNEIYALLRPEHNPVLREKLTSRSLKALKDIEEGRVYSVEEARDRLNRLFDR